MEDSGIKKKYLVIKSMNNNEEKKQEYNGELKMITSSRQFIKFLRHKKFGGNKRKFRKEKNNKGELCNRDVIISYEGKKLRHIKYDCLNVIKRSKFDKNQKALMAST